MALATPLLTPLLSRAPSSSSTSTPALPSTPKKGKGGASVVLGRHSWGRPPWYDQTGRGAPAYVIGIAGGSASGKVRLAVVLPSSFPPASELTLTSDGTTTSGRQTSVAKEILSALNHVPNVVILSQDSFYRKHDAAELELAFKSELDFDHPSAIDWGRFESVLRGLRRGEAVEVRLLFSFAGPRLGWGWAP